MDIALVLLYSLPKKTTRATECRRLLADWTQPFSVGKVVAHNVRTRVALPYAEIHVMDAGHFALDLAPDADAIAEWMRDFLGRNGL